MLHPSARGDEGSGRPSRAITIREPTRAARASTSSEMEGGAGWMRMHAGMRRGGGGNFLFHS